MTATPGKSNLVFDHIGIVTADIDKGVISVAAMFGATGFTRRFDDAGLGVSVRFVRDASGIVYELIAPFGDTSPVAGTLKSKKNLLNQVAYRTALIEESGEQLRTGGCLPLGAPAPAKAFGGARVQFFWSPDGFIVELIEDFAWQHEFHESLNNTGLGPAV